MAHLIACLKCRPQSGYTSTGWVMTGDGVPSRAWQSAARLRFETCRAVRFNRHNNRRRVRASGHAKRYDSSGTTSSGTFVLRGMPGDTIHPAQQPAARLCFGACQAVRFIQHNNRRRVRDSGHAGKYDSSSTTSGGATDRTDPSRRLAVALHITYSIIKKPHEHLRTARALCAAL